MKIVSVGGGTVYGSLGYTHHAVEDLAVMRTLPNITVVAPGDPVEVRLATRALAALPGPAYLRLGRASETVVHAREPVFELGKPIVVRDGDDAVVVSTGGMLVPVVQAADALAADGLRVRVLSLHTLKPLDAAALARAVAGPAHVFCVAEHVQAGGLGELAAARLAGLLAPGVTLHDLHLQPGTLFDVGRREHLLAQHGLDPAGIAAAVRDALQAGGRRAADGRGAARPR